MYHPYISSSTINVKVDEVYRTLMGEVKAMQKDINRSATKEEFQVLLASKVNQTNLYLCIS